MTDTEKNKAYLPTAKRLLRTLEANYRTVAPGLGYKLTYGPSVTTALQLPVQPPAVVVDLFNQFVAFHRTFSPSHGVQLMGASNIVPQPGRTIYYHPAGVAAYAMWEETEPSPYDEPPIIQPPPSCIPCIEPIYIARGPA